MRKKRLDANSRCSILNDLPSIKTGSTVVTNIQTNARNIVLPIAIFFNSLKKVCGNFGAEYKKVTKPANASAIQCERSTKK